MVHKAEEGVAVTVFFDEDVTEARITQMGELPCRDGPGSISDNLCVSGRKRGKVIRKNILEIMHSLQKDSRRTTRWLILDHYEVYLNDVAKQDSLVKYIQNIDGVRKVNYSSAVADTLSDVNILIGYISVAVMVILLAVAVFLIK